MDSNDPYLNVQNFITDFENSTYHYKFSLNSPVHIKKISNVFYPPFNVMYKTESIFYVTNRFVKNNKRKYRLIDVEGLALSPSFFEKELEIASIIRPGKLIDCQFSSSKHNTITNLLEIRVKWQGLDQRYDTWMSPTIFSYLKFKKHFKFGNKYCLCKKLNNKYSYFYVLLKKRYKDPLWKHRLHKVPCKKYKDGKLHHMNQSCLLEYRELKVHLTKLDKKEPLY